jgi:acetyl esterase/lipase
VVPRALARSLAALALLLGAGAAALGCGDGEVVGEVSARQGSWPPSVVGTSPAIEVFDGSIRDFYVVPQPLPTGEPGDLIRVQPLGEAGGLRSYRVMYHSNDARGRDRAVTGVVSHPTADPPKDGWVVTSWAHPSRGLVAPCAPSRRPMSIPDFGMGGVRAATDYVGLGPVGEVHPYLSKPSEGNAVIDIVRAARQLPGSGAGRRWFAAGHSQGGHAALAAAELAVDRAPELELLGTVAWAPGTAFDRSFGGGIDDLVSRAVSAMALYGSAAEHPEIDPASYLGDAVAAAAELAIGACGDRGINTLLQLAADPSFWARDPGITSPAREVIAANEVGNVASDAPLLLVSGSLDPLVVTDRVRSLFDRLCASGQVTDLRIVNGANHGDIVMRTAVDAGAWMAARLAGELATDSCPSGS